MLPTTSVRVCVLEGAPAVLALILTGNVPNGVVDDVEMLRLIETGLPLVGDTAVEGWNWQATPIGKLEHESVMEPLKLPVAETEKETGPFTLPRVTFRLAGEGAAREKPTICNVSEM